MSRTVVIYGLDYWPDVTGIAPYTTGFAEYLARDGHEVHVVAGMPYYPQWKVNPDYRRTLRRTEERYGVVIHRHRQYIPRRQSALHRAAYEATFLANASVRNGLPRRPDVVIGVMPALSDGILAARHAQRSGAPFSLWIQDLFGQASTQSGMPGGRRIARATAAIEGRIVRQATSIGIVANGFRPVLESMNVDPSRIHRLHNWTHIAAPSMDRGEARSALGLPLDRTICLHAGNMGYKQGLENVVDAARIAITEAPHIHFVFLGDGNQREHLERQAAGLPNVRFVDPVPDEMFPNALGAADVLLVNQRESVKDMSLPSKLTSYVAAGRPIVAAVHPESETALACRERNLGLQVGPNRPEDLVRAILACASIHPDTPPAGATTSSASNELLMTRHALVPE